MNNQFQLPEMLDSHLERDAVNSLLNEFLYVLTEQYNNRHPKLDWSWTDGTKLYGWAKQHVKNMHDEGKYPWFKMISNNMDFVFSVNQTPIQFTKDCISSPTKKHRLLMNKVEYEQYCLFADSEPELDIKWRVMVERNIDVDDSEDDSIPPVWTVALVGFNQYASIVAMQSIEGYISSIPVQIGDGSMPQEKEIKAAAVFRRRSEEQEDNGSV